MKLITLTLALILSFNVFASENEKGTWCQIKNIIGPPPAQGSPEEAVDFAILFGMQMLRTTQMCADAAAQDDVALDTFFGGPNGPLSKDEIKRLKFFFLRYMLKAGIPSAIGKAKFKRPRPYDANPNLIPCIPREKSYAYPSGHTAVARVLARALGQKFPERAEAFLLAADQVALNRVIGGVHHPSDIVAGKVLGDHLSRKLMSDKNFMLELEGL